MVLLPKCPFCRKVSILGSPFFPFCSEQCKLRDLGKWANEEYGVAAEDQPSFEDSESDEGET